MKTHISISLILIILFNCIFGYAQTRKTHYKTRKYHAAAHSKATVMHHNKGIAANRKKRVIIHHGKNITLHRKNYVAKQNSKSIARHHKGKKYHNSKDQKTFSIDDHSTSAIVEIKNGNIYVNDKLFSNIKNIKNEDQKIIINYIVSPSPTSAISTNNSVPEENKVAGTQTKKAILGIHACNYLDEGAMIEYILPYSPADEVGFLPGDVITKIDDHNINNTQTLIHTIESLNPGDSITITYKNYYGTETVRVKLADNEKMDFCKCHKMYMSYPMDNE